ncbi:DUF4123 domain-containing protein [Shewanella algae]|uniref:DUF4123 domain-containing protein n=1 Tax=Shewanella algae TaxID=38313 RepID=UPI00131F50DA|nr:DUF4123 domain-containing protein [Shewanella algae]MCE9773866.1 DUF4123 domain-containing protein [Shewanella algae]QHD55517.1 DUF4123 domain-containing protein [Shewanella algae]QNV05087.1 DUF4123 domain-containing protein [Shewanella algae]
MTMVKENSLNAFGANYLVLDAALCPEPLWFAKGAGAECHSLFDYRDQALVDNGPWLLHLAGQDELIKLMLEKDTHGHSALWCKSELALQSLKEALGQRLYAVKPDGETTRFRFYDPRVLHHYLTEETQARRDAFLEPLGSVLYASLNPFRFNSHWLNWQREPDGYGCQAISIKED